MVQRLIRKQIMMHRVVMLNWSHAFVELHGCMSLGRISTNCLIYMVCGSFMSDDSLPFHMSLLEMLRVHVVGMLISMMHIMVWRLMDQVAELGVTMQECVVMIDIVMTLHVRSL